MCSDVVITARGLCKTYYTHRHPLGRLLRALQLGSHGGTAFPALRGADFEIRRGECVGIIGRNGSGKSTLLQLVCGTRHPTAGTIEVRGRVAAMLELGAGFHPELTGRENLYLQGAVQGMSRREMDAAFPDIAAFADIGAFMDEPVRTYSSGMFVRLAFAVATAIHPDILVVDEALAVGDALFRARCFRRISEIRAAGGTILLASHAADQILAVCDRALLLDGGEILATGAPRDMLTSFHKLLYCPPEQRAKVRAAIRSGATPSPALPNAAHVLEGEQMDTTLNAATPVVYESAGAVIATADIVNADGAPVNVLVRGGSYRFRYEVRFEREVPSVRFGMLIKTSTGIELGGGASTPAHEGGIAVRGGDIVQVQFTFTCALNAGVYFLNAGVTGYVDGEERMLHRIVDARAFRVAAEAGSMVTALVDFGCVPDVRMGRDPAR